MINPSCCTASGEGTSLVRTRLDASAKDPAHGSPPVHACTLRIRASLPGDALYNWKLTSEHVWRLTSNDQLSVDITLSNRRVNELVTVSDNAARRARAIENYEKLLIKFQAEQDELKRARILPILRAQHEALIKAGVVIPELEVYFPR